MLDAACTPAAYKMYITYYTGLYLPLFGLRGQGSRVLIWKKYSNPGKMTCRGKKKAAAASSISKKSKSAVRAVADEGESQQTLKDAAANAD